MTEAIENQIVQSDLDPTSPTSPLNPSNWGNIVPTEDLVPVGGQAQ